MTLNPDLILANLAVARTCGDIQSRVWDDDHLTAVVVGWRLGDCYTLAMYDYHDFGDNYTLAWQYADELREWVLAQAADKPATRISDFR